MKHLFCLFGDGFLAPTDFFHGDEDSRLLDIGFVREADAPQQHRPLWIADNPLHAKMLPILGLRADLKRLHDF